MNKIMFDFALSGEILEYYIFRARKTNRILYQEPATIVTKEKQLQSYIITSRNYKEMDIFYYTQ